MFAACTQDEVNKCVDQSKAAQKLWAKTPLWTRAEKLHKFAAIMKAQQKPIAECLVDEVAKCFKDAVTEVKHDSAQFLFSLTFCKGAVFLLKRALN